jgi:hypothetical protein
LAAALLALPLAACRGFLSDESTPVAIQIVYPPDTIVVGDTVRITVEALNRSGDVIPDAAVFLIALTPDTVAIGPDSVSVIGVAAPGGGSVLAGVGNLRSVPFRIIVRTP